LDFLNDLAVIPLNENIEKKAIELRRSTKLKLPDSIVAATSIILDAILLTDDEHLLSLSLPDLKTQSIL
jgi:predicted nucleic acid-binding protein